MTYFSFLLLFLVVPIGLLLILTVRDRQRGKIAVGFLDGWSVWLAIGLHVLLAIVYTTPWDNYLVATRVWYYNPNLISGVVLGWVPLEEYIFFVLETCPGGLVVATACSPGEDKWGVSPQEENQDCFNSRPGSGMVLTVSVLISGWKPGDLPFIDPGLGVACHHAAARIWRGHPVAFSKDCHIRDIASISLCFGSRRACHFIRYMDH